MLRRKLVGASVVVTASLLALGCSSESTGSTTGTSEVRIVKQIKNDESRPLRDLVREAANEADQGDSDSADPGSNDPDRGAPGQSADKVPDKIPRHTPNLNSAAQGPDPVAQLDVRPLTVPATKVNIDGVGTGFTGPQGSFTPSVAPPDTNGDIGKSHYIQTVNLDFAVLSKDGTVVLGPSPTNTLFKGFGGDCESTNDGDPVVQYDQLADRWIISQFSVTNGPPYLQCVAVSTTGDPTGTWYRYSFQFTDFNDYPKLGIWPDGYYFTYNIFTGGVSFGGGEVCAADRAKMLTGAPATQQCFSTGNTQGGLLTSDVDGMTPPPSGAPNFVVNFDTNSLNLWKLHVDFATPSNTKFTGPTKIPVANFKTPCNDTAGSCVTQQGGGNLDTLGDRMMYRLAYRNFGDHESLVMNHSVDTATNGPTGVRWYELRDPNGTPSVFQQGTYAPGDSNHRWMGSIAMDHKGNIALGFSTSGTGMKPAIRYTGRLASDAPGQMTLGEGTIIQGTGAQDGSLSRWGDYSAMTVDPVDDCTFWFASEYLKTDGSFNWSTRIANFQLPNCSGQQGGNDFSESVSPDAQTIAAGSSGAFTVSTAVTSGSAETVTFSVTGLPAGVTGSFDPPSVTAGGSSTLTLKVDPSAASTSATITITGTAPSAAHAVNPSLTVTGRGTGGIVSNGDFETGDLTGWSTVGPTTSSTTAHGGKFAAQIGSSSGFTGTTTMTQQISVPAKGTTSLTFWYNSHCTGPRRTDYETAQIRSTSGKRLKQIFTTCSNKGIWLHSKSYDLTPFAGTDVVLYFGAHDDGTDPTYYLLDDVTVTNQ